MSAATQASEEGSVEKEARNGSNSTLDVNIDGSEKSVESPPVSAGSMTED